MTTYKNEIVKIAPGYNYFDAGGSRIGAFSRSQVGNSLGEFFGYNVVGLFPESDFTVDSEGKYVLDAELPVQDGAEPGFFQYENENNKLGQK
ncbi:MAG: hypothetical protein U5K79_15665 [Cyclobacteriaceae bacterium]|nr:hypothetical protein [Cyclobacteriaceae bacterium]